MRSLFPRRIWLENLLVLRQAGFGFVLPASVGLAFALQLASCKRHEAVQDATLAMQNPSREVNAAWYDVPEDSLARRRAGSSELTAAHNKLPLGTLVRVTHVANGKAVNVRITDRGIHDSKVKLDLCKQAAEELGMVGQGIARVRMEVLENAQGGAPAGQP